jgi:AbiU2
MQITIKSGEELSKLLDALTKDIVDANIYYRLSAGLNISISDYQKEVSQSNTFWWLTTRAIKEAYLLRLCRIFDQHDRSLNLVNLLDTIQSNLHFFQELHFRERLKDNPFVEFLAEDVRIPSMEELQADIEFASDKNPIIEKLMLWRHNVYAHTGAKIALGKKGALDVNEISKEEMEHLLDECFSISNKYLNMYKATRWSRQIDGHDDYLSLFKLLHIGLEKYQADIQREMDSLKHKSVLFLTLFPSTSAALPSTLRANGVLGASG